MKPKALIVQLRAWFLRPRVVHRLPGRLRVRIPALKRMDHVQREWAFVWRDLLASLTEIETVEVNLTTGNVLIRYRGDQLTESELLAFLQAVNRLVLRHWDRLAATPADQLPSVLKRFVRFMRDATRRRLAIDEKVEIPEDVWV